MTEGSGVVGSSDDHTSLQDLYVEYPTPLQDNAGGFVAQPDPAADFMRYWQEVAAVWPRVIRLEKELKDTNGPCTRSNQEYGDMFAEMQVLAMQAFNATGP